MRILVTLCLYLYRTTYTLLTYQLVDPSLRRIISIIPQKTNIIFYLGPVVLIRLMCTHIGDWCTLWLINLDVVLCLEWLCKASIYTQCWCWPSWLYAGTPVVFHTVILQTEQWQSAWCYQILKEQILVLESLLVHLHKQRHIEQSRLHELLDKFKTSTLTGQAHTDLKPLIEDIHRPLLVRIE